MSAKSFEKQGIFENFVSFFAEEAPGGRGVGLGVNEKLRDFFQEPMMTPAMVLQVCVCVCVCMQFFRP